jgi:hypothetical protein
MNEQCKSSTANITSAVAIPCAASSDSTTTISRLGGFGFEKPNTGETNDWLTPPELLQRLGTFDLDPCGCPGMPWRTATTTYSLPEHDGLSEPWCGRVFCNSPYGPNVRDWARRMAAHGNGILLIIDANRRLPSWRISPLPVTALSDHWYHPCTEHAAGIRLPAQRAYTPKLFVCDCGSAIGARCFPIGVARKLEAS